MLDLVTRKSPSRRLLALGRVLPMVLGLLTLFFLEVSTQVHTPQTHPLSDTPPKSRLVIFLVDSLSTMDMETTGRMSRLKARMPTGLHGPVRECMDAVTVPCFTAANTGIDRFSLFSIVRNFGGASGVAPGSVFHALQERGFKLGLVGDEQLAAAAAGFDWLFVQHELDDPRAVEQGLAGLDREALDLVVIHLREGDELSHTRGPASPEYANALEAIDRDIDAAFARLRPSDHVFVFGDHGHTADGKHFAGLDLPTYAAAFGPMFQRPVSYPMAITDHATLWARVFGLRFGDRPWIEAYFRGEPLPPPPPKGELPQVTSGNATLSFWGGLVGVLLAILVAVPHRTRWLGGRARRPLLWLLLGVGSLAFVTGMAYTGFRPVIHYGSRPFNLGIALGCGLLGLAMAWPARHALHHGPDAPRARPLGALFMAGAVALALPTVYKYGGLHVGLVSLMGVSLIAGLIELRSRRFPSAGLSLGLVALLLMVWNPAVRSFAVRWFTVFTEILVDVQWPAVIGLGALALGLAAGSPGASRWPWLLAGAAGFAVTALGSYLPPRAFILPCMALLPLALATHRRPQLGPALAFVAPPALTFFFGYDPVRLGPVLVMLAAFPVWARARAGASLLERGVGLTLLLWLSLWTMLGCRIGGLDFNYFFKWLPAGANVEATWAWNTLLTTTLYMGTPIVGLALARRANDAAVTPAMPVAWYFARMKLGLVLLFIVGFSLHSADAGAFVTADVLMEAGVWVVLLLFLAPLPLGEGVERPDVSPAPGV